MSDKTPIRFTDLFRYYRGLSHQLSALQMLGEQIPASLLHRDNEWFKVWSQDGKQDDLAEGLKLIKTFEGCRLTAYPDPGTGGDPWTIGWGNTRYSNGKPVMRGDQISQAVADAMLQEEVDRIAQRLGKVVPYWVQMSENQKGALCSFAYNLGSGFFNTAGFNTISACLREKRWADVPAALMLYCNPGTSVEAGLRRRRAAEGQLWLKP